VPGPHLERPIPRATSTSSNNHESLHSTPTPSTLLPPAIDTMSSPLAVLRQARLAQAPKLNVQRRFLNMQPTRRAMRPVPVRTDA
jgi:hypothetical protein